MPRHIGYKDDGAVGWKSDIVEKVARELGTRDVLRKNADPSYFAKLWGQQTLLKHTCVTKFLFHALEMLSVAAIQSSQLKASFNKAEQHAAVEWFLKKVECILPNRPDKLCIELMDTAGHENNIQFGIKRLQLFHQLEPIHLGHLNI